jgi:hypothetical protein
MAPWSNFKLTAALIIPSKKATPRGASVRALTFSRRAAAFSPVGASRRLQLPIGVCHSGKRRAASLAGDSFVPPTLLAQFIHLPALGELVTFCVLARCPQAQLA